ncbi:MAG: hypothetical protein KGJ80_03550 [Chloroflexota bacterium]|nr:hypothetical protein [Chloroflexota bacterium]
MPPEEREKLMRYGALVLERDTASRLVFARRKLDEFERKYGMALERLNEVGLPEDAGLGEHEDYVEWSGWQTTFDEATAILNNLRVIIETTDAGYPVR